jgi:cardiolipin synthase (CMP-forming)
METESSSNRVLTIPNLLSFARLLTVPVFLWLWLSDRRDAAVILYAAGAWTDFFDGKIARATNSVTELGKLLDPIADRVFIITLAVALVAADVLPWWLMGVLVVRDVILLAAFPILEKKGVERIAVNFVGKSATAALLAGLTTLAISETSVSWADVGVIPGLTLTVLGAVLYWIAAALYGREAVQRLQALGGRGTA